MIVKLFVFRHAETTDNAQMLFSGWRDPGLTAKGFEEACEVADQLRDEAISYAFTSHLTRARTTLDVVLRSHPPIPVFVDDRLIERCYGTLQGQSKIQVSQERPEWFAKIHRGYEYPPPEGESLQMVERRTIPFIRSLRKWLEPKPGNIALACHGNSMRPIRRIFEHLTLQQMLQIENPQDTAIAYALHVHEVHIEPPSDDDRVHPWHGIVVPTNVKLATDPRNPLQKYYDVPQDSPSRYT